MSEAPLGYLIKQWRGDVLSLRSSAKRLAKSESYADARDAKVAAETMSTLIRDAEREYRLAFGDVDEH